VKQKLSCLLLLWSFKKMPERLKCLFEKNAVCLQST
jgi:hypothetical protein